jgi:hypothetical protein
MGGVPIALRRPGDVMAVLALATFRRNARGNPFCVAMAHRVLICSVASELLRPDGIAGAKARRRPATCSRGVD